MAKVTIEESELYDIADAIRDGNGETQAYYPREMAPAIRRIGGGTGLQEVFEAYVVGEVDYAADWLSYTVAGQPFGPERSRIYVIASGPHRDEAYRWDGTAYSLVSPVDAAIDPTSPHAVANSAVAEALDNVSVDVATTTDAGIVRPDGTSITVDADGTIHGAQTYELPTMSTTTKGGAKVGAGLSMDGDALTASPVQDALADLATEVAAIDVPSPSTASPAMDGTAAVGTSESYARADHVHPTDTTRASAQDLADLAETVSNIKSTDSSDGTVAGPILSLSAKGWAEQDTTSGKNLLPVSPRSGTAAGVTFVNESSGTITLNGTATANQAANILTDRTAMLPAGTYTVSITGSSDATAYVTLKNGTITAGESYTFTISEAYELAQVAKVYVLSGHTYNNCKLSVQLELGSTATAYEPYTGGKASPNPDYPQEIRVAKGRNLIESTIASANINGSGVVSSSATYYLSIGRVVAGKTYIASGFNATSNMQLVYGFFSSMPAAMGDTTYNASRTVDDSGSAFVAPISGYVAIRVANDATTPQLELGSIAHPYVPYGHVGLDVVGKNLLNPSLREHVLPYTTAGITYSETVDGGIHVVGTATGNAFLQLIKQGPNAIEPGTYTMTVEGSVDGIVGQVAYQTSAGGSSTYVMGTTASNPSGSGTIPDTAYSSMCRVYVQAGKTVDTVIYPQLEKGNVATEWTPYINYAIPIPLPSRGWVAGLPDGTADTLTLDGAGKVTWELANEGRSLPSTADWILTGTGNARRFGAPLVLAGIASASANNRFYCTHFIEGDFNNSKGNNHIRVYASGYTDIRADEIATVDDFKAFLSNNNVTVLYPLATPTTESGYVDEWPTIPAGASISCPELDELGVEYFVDTAPAEMARQWYERSYAELSDAIVDLAERVSALES